MDPHIGMKVWEFDERRRVYERDENGKSKGGPIWREHWVEREIIGETSRSWLVGPEWMKGQLDRAMKISKREWPGGLAISQEEIDRLAFVNSRYLISQRVQVCRDYDALKAIVAALDAAGVK